VDRVTTAAFANKRTIFDRFANYTGTGQALDGVQVEYSFPGSPTETLVYGGRITFEQTVDDELVSGDDVQALDVATIWVYVRISGEPTVRDAQIKAEVIGDTLGMILRKEPRMCGPNTHVRIAGGTGDHYETDDGPIVHLAYRITATAYV
jgi:hypothetical protein